MKIKIIRSRAALRDLSEHYRYLAKNVDVQLAERFLQAVDRAFLLLADMPEMAPRREFENSRLSSARMWPLNEFPAYLIFFEPISTGIRILRVLHASQDYNRILK